MELTKKEIDSIRKDIAKQNSVFSDKKYLDFCNAYGALLLGHQRKEIISSVSSQLKKGTLYCAPTELEVELAELINKNYQSMDKIRLVNTGSEATMTAIRLARGFTKKMQHEMIMTI